MEEVVKAIEELKEKAKSGWVILVEGKKDEIALRNLGIEGEFVIFSGLASTAEKLRGRRVVIMTDYDERGMMIEKSLLRALPNSVDVQIKKKIFCYAKKDVTKVEELYEYFLREGYAGI
uniref:Toprim domain-containing protein n=1 Tax=Archaeoglobus fulgidus TaxID=2234 RepID=A0A7J2TLD5_ARCFL